MVSRFAWADHSGRHRRFLGSSLLLMYPRFVACELWETTQFLRYSHLFVSSCQGADLSVLVLLVYLEGKGEASATIVLFCRTLHVCPRALVNLLVDFMGSKNLFSCHLPTVLG